MLAGKSLRTITRVRKSMGILLNVGKLNLENSTLSWKTNTEITDSGSKTDAGKIDGGWRSDVSPRAGAPPDNHVLHELAQKRKRGPGLPLVPQAKERPQ